MAVLGALGDLVLSLSADTAKFQSDLGKAHREAEKFGRDVGRALGVAVGAFLTFAGASGGLVKSQIDAADAAGKMAQKVGTSTEALSEYMVAAQLADVSNEQLQTGMVKLAKAGAEFAAGIGESDDAFRVLGITQDQVKALGGDTAKMFDLVAGKLAGFEDDMNKTALLVKIFGKSGAELAPLINGLEATKKEAAELGAVIDKQTAAAAEEFNDNLTRLGIVVRGVGLGLARDVLPTLKSVSEELVIAAKATQEFTIIGDAFRVVWQTLAVLGSDVAFVFKMVGGQIGATVAGMRALQRGDFKGFRLIAEEWKRDAALARADLDAFQYRVMNVGVTMKGATRDIHAFEEGLSKRTAPALRDTAKEAKEAEERFKALKNAMQAVHDEAANAAAADQEISKRTAERMKEDIELAEKHSKAYLIDEQEQRSQFEQAQDVTEAREQATKAWVESAEAATEASENMIYTWDEAGNRLVIAKDAFEEIERQQKETTEDARKLGLTFTSAFEDAVLGGKSLRDVLHGIEMDIARIILRKAITEPAADAISGAVKPVTAAASEFFKGMLPSFDVGTSYVQQDGPAMLHRGEAVLTAEENAARRDGATSVQVSFTIVANDTRGFDHLLASRQELIVGIINRAVERSGRPGGFPA